MKLTLVVAMFLDFLTFRNERRTLGRVEYQPLS